MITLYKTILSTEKDIVSIRSKLNDALIVLTNDQMFSTQKASILSFTLKKTLKSFKESYCTISIGTSNVIENNLDVEIFQVENSIDSDNKTYSLIEKLSFVYPFDMARIEDVKKMFEIKTVDELLVDIQYKNSELENSLQNLRVAKDQNARMEGELEVGQSIQMGMLPEGQYRSNKINLNAKLIPAREVGGDFYDFFEIGSERLGIVMGDVSGKGVPAALMMAVCKTLLKAEATDSRSTAEVIKSVNNTMAAENKNYMFVTIFLGILNTDSGELVYTNAGHCPTYVLRNNGSIDKLSVVHGPAVAAMEDILFSEDVVQIKDGDKIIAYTDGIPEAHDVNKNLYGDDRLENLIKNSEENVEDLADSIIDSVIEFEKGTERFDDLTVLCLEYILANKDEKLIKIGYDIDKLKTSLEEVEVFLMSAKVGFGIITKLQIALDEVISNIIKYSHIIDSDHILLEITKSEDSIKLVVTDEGIEFNPLLSNEPDTELSLEERQIGGLGIHIVKNIMSKVNYERINNKNMLTLILNI